MQRKASKLSNGGARTESTGMTLIDGVEVCLFCCIICEVNGEDGRVRINRSLFIFLTINIQILR